MIQWLRLPFKAGGVGSIPGQRLKIPHALGPKKNFETIKALKTVHIKKKKKTLKKTVKLQNFIGFLLCAESGGEVKGGADKL